MRVGMIGTIDHINIFGPAAAAHEEVEFVGVAEPDRERGEKLAADYGTRWYPTSEALLDEGLDAVGVFTPFTNRGEEIAGFLDAGLHVFVDKPAAINQAGLDLIQAAVERNPGLKLTMGLVLRGRPPYLKMKSLIEAGAIGEVVNVIARKSYTLRRAKRPTFMFDAALSGGEWIELAVHDVDLVSWLVGRQYSSVTAAHGNVTSPSEPYQDNGAALFTFAGGGTAFIQHDRLNPSTDGCGLQWHMTLVGSNGVLDLGEELRLWNDDGPTTVIEDLPEELSFFNNFVDAIQTETPLIITPQDVFSVTSTVLATYESACDGGRTVILPVGRDNV